MNYKTQLTVGESRHRALQYRGKIPREISDQAVTGHRFLLIINFTPRNSFLSWERTVFLFVRLFMKISLTEREHWMGDALYKMPNV